MLIGLIKAKTQVEIYNIGSEDQTNVKNMLPDISKIETLGWKPKHNIEPAIAKIVKEHAFYLYFLNYPLSC